MTTISAGRARLNLCRLLNQVAKTHEPILILRKRTNAVLVSEEKWNAVQEMLYLCSNPKLHRSIKESMNTPLEGCERKLNWCLDIPPVGFPAILKFFEIWNKEQENEKRN